MIELPGAQPLPPDLFAGPVKRSVTIAGHPTSISLEPLFWDALRIAAQTRQLPLNALIAQIDLLRIGQSDPANLASAIRLWLFVQQPVIIPQDTSENHSQ